ncbi:MAG: tetratricopeptide repeat protein [Bacteroidota bacterium]
MYPITQSIFQRCLLTFVLSLLMTLPSRAQDTLSASDKLEISYTAKLMVKELESLMNVISNENISLSQTEILVNNSFSSQSPNQIFYRESSVIEDDVDPRRTNKGPAVDVSARRYLQDLDIFYTKSPQPSISFSNIQSSAIEKKEYTYIKVYFDRNFDQRHKEVTQVYRPQGRIAELRADRDGGRWKTRIVSLIFANPEDEFVAVDYQNVAAPETLAASTGEAPVAVDSRVDDLAQQAAAIEREYLQDFEQRMQERIKLFEEEKANSFKQLVERGDQALTDENFELALSSYQEAQAVDPYQVALLKKINRVRTIMDDKLAMEKRQYRNALKYGIRFQTMHEYEKALTELRKANEMRPGIDSVENRIKKLEQRLVYINFLKSKFSQSAPSDGVKVYSKELKEKPTDPDVYFGRATQYVAQKKAKQAIKDLNESLTLDKEHWAAYSLRARLHEEQGNAGQAIADYGMALSIFKDPDLFLKRAQLRLKEKQNPAALSDYAEAISLAPQNPDLYLIRGKVRYQQNMFTEAAQDFSDVVRLAPERNDGWYQRGLAYVKLDNVYAAGTDFEKARSLGLGEAEIQAVRRIADQFYQSGLTTHRAGNYQEATTAFTNALLVQPDFAGAWFARGEAHFAQDENLRAADDYTKAIANQAKYPEAHFQRAKAFYALGKKESAVSDYGKAAMQLPSMTKASILQGDVLTELERPVEAITAYQTALKQDGELATAHYKVGRLQVDLQQFDKAILALTLALKYDKKDANALYMRGLAYVGKKDDTKAFNDFSAAIKLRPKYPEALYERASVQVRAGKANKAIPDLTAAILQSPDYAEAHFMKAEAHYALQQFNSAATHFDKWLAQNDSVTLPNPLLHAGYTFLHQAQIDKAKQLFEKVKILDESSMPRVEFGLACCELAANNKEAAMPMLESALKSGNFTKKELKKNALLSSVQKDAAFKKMIKAYAK